MAEPVVDPGPEAPPETHPVEEVLIADLRPHPENYQKHPQDQIEHLVASIRQYGFIRNVVIARDNTILCGHGAVEAATLAGMTSVPCVRLDLDPMSTKALKVLALENELGRFAVRDDRALTEILKIVNDDDGIMGLVGTGYDEQMLANLVMVTRSAAEIANGNAAAEWVGMPEYEEAPDIWKIIIQFDSEKERQEFLEKYEVREYVTFVKMTPRAISGWWPQRTEVRNDGGLRWVKTEDADKDPAEVPAGRADWG